MLLIYIMFIYGVNHDENGDSDIAKKHNSLFVNVTLRFCIRRNLLFCFETTSWVKHNVACQHSFQ